MWQKTARTVARYRQQVLTGIVALVAVMALGTAGLLYRHEQALVAAETREHEMLALVDHVSIKGDLLQTHFLELQGEIDALASTAGLALQHTAPSDARFFWVDDFEVGARQPPDLIPVDGLTHPQSVTFTGNGCARHVAARRASPRGCIERSSEPCAAGSRRDSAAWLGIGESDERRHHRRAG